MIDFYRTRAGLTFFEATLPRLVAAVERLAAAAERIAQALDRDLAVSSALPGSTSDAAS